MSNPFIHGNPVSHLQFLDRHKELRRLASRIVCEGQSSAVIGEPRSGKTSLLTYLAAPATRLELYGCDAARIVFAYLDAQTLGAQFGQPQFWEYVLRPFREQAILLAPDSALAQAYTLCQANQFGAYVLERLLAQMRQSGWRLVLLLDEFDVLLHHPTLNRAEFFGSLRSLASRSEGALAVVLASRRPLDILNRETQELSRTGSPFFNIFSELVLGPWPDEAIDQFMSWAGDRFSEGDRRFVTALAGGHPYLLQAAASALWEAYQDTGLDAQGRWREAGQNLYDEAGPTLGQIWRFWGARVRQACIGITLAYLTALADRDGGVQPGQYDVATIRHLIRDAFTDKTLRRHCQDHRALTGVVTRFPSGASLEDMIDVLVEHCEKQVLFGELLAGIREANPRQYGRYEPRLAAPGMPAGVPALPELGFLAKQGFVCKDGAVLGGWRIRPLLFLWWLADELVRAASSPEAFRTWLQVQALDFILAPEEVHRLSAAAQAIGQSFPEGMASLVTSVAVRLSSAQAETGE
jgi:AAA-like domain